MSRTFNGRGTRVLKWLQTRPWVLMFNYKYICWSVVDAYAQPDIHVCVCIGGTTRWTSSSDEDILGDLSPCGLRSPNFENLDLPGWVGGGRMVISVCAGGLVWFIFSDWTQCGCWWFLRWDLYMNIYHQYRMGGWWLHDQSDQIKEIFSFRQYQTNQIRFFSSSFIHSMKSFIFTLCWIIYFYSVLKL